MSQGMSPAMDRLCIHTITTKPWNIHQCIDNYRSIGAGGISVWRDALKGEDPARIGEKISASGLHAVSLVRGGFFTYPGDKASEQAFSDNLRALEECAAIGSDLLVLVCGATPGNSVAKNLGQIRSGIEALLPHAEKLGVRLGIEPLHPMYADTRSSVVTMACAMDLCDAIDSPSVGVTVDVFHVWWDEHLGENIRRCARRGKLFSFHICDWKTDMTDMLNDRGLMGEGVIDIPRIRAWGEETGF
ncbi:MAG: sugar phosphate isomerase/epimerase, partial [Planctomycetes bacterium]|nr:sugar phosphate isomerase/epimerase [Planctomycetota bacterium]